VADNVLGVPIPIGDNGGCDSPISCLLLFGRPLAIFFAVLAVVINSVKAVVSGALPHIFEKSGKRNPPTATGDTSASVPMVVCSFRVITPATHRPPRLVCWGSAASMMRGSVCSNGVYMGAAAGGGLPAKDRVDKRGVHLSASANTVKERVIAFTIVYLHSFYNCESTV
jgi:hypothetical protein